MKLAFFFLGLVVPPFGIFLTVGVGPDLLINVVLTLLGWIPGSIHATWVIAKKYEDDKNVIPELYKIICDVAKKYTTQNESVALALEDIKKKINDNPTFKQRLKGCLKRGGQESFKSISEEPFVKIVIEALIGFLEGK